MTSPVRFGAIYRFNNDLVSRNEKHKAFANNQIPSEKLDYGQIYVVMTNEENNHLDQFIQAKHRAVGNSQTLETLEKDFATLDVQKLNQKYAIQNSAMRQKF